MTDYPGVLDTRTKTDLFTHPLGKSDGMDMPPPGTLNGAFNIGALAIPYAAGDDLTFVDATVSQTTTDYPGNLADQATQGIDWFEAVHLLPRAGVDFGNIITAVDERFELFSAFRYADVTLLSVLNNALPGTEMPDLPATPATLGPLQSFIDPLSATLNPLAQIVRALADGLSSFDTTIDFTFGSGVGTLFLGVEGNRIVLLTTEFDGGVRETLEWKTDILEKQDGTEQRISTRKNPRQLWSTRLFLTEVQRQRVQAILFGWQGRTISIMAWPEQMTITQAISADTTDTAQVRSTDYVDLRIGALAVVFKEDLTFDVLTVLSKTSTSVTFDQNISNAYAIGDLVIPVRLAVLKSPVSGSRPPVNVEFLDLQFTVIENDIGIPTGDTAAFSSYNSKVLLDDANFINGSVQESFIQDIIIVDNETGILSQSSPWTQNKRGHIKGFVTGSRQSLWNIRRLLYALKGKQTSFYIPTFMEDLTVTQNLTSGNDTMTISWIGYVRFIQDREPKATFKITFTDGSSLIRVVQSSEQLSATEEKLTLDANWPSLKTPDEVERIQFYELVRIDTDSIAIEHHHIVGRSRIFFPVKAVFD